MSLEFVSYSDAELAEFAGNVATSLAKNTAFPNPPVSAADLSALANTFHSATQAALQGGLQLTAAKNAAREPVVDALRKIGSYVQSIANHDQQMLLSSGFYAGRIKRSRSPLEKPAITLVENVATTRLLVRRARAVGGSTGYSEWSDPVARMAT